jgi:hypothetical protein
LNSIIVDGYRYEIHLALFFDCTSLRLDTVIGQVLAVVSGTGRFQFSIKDG